MTGKMHFWHPVTCNWLLCDLGLAGLAEGVSDGMDWSGLAIGGLVGGVVSGVVIDAPRGWYVVGSVAKSSPQAAMTTAKIIARHFGIRFCYACGSWLLDVKIGSATSGCWLVNLRGGQRAARDKRRGRMNRFIPRNGSILGKFPRFARFLGITQTFSVLHW